MKRKVIQLSEKTLVISLPSDWIKSQGVKKGSEVECLIQDSNLLISPAIASSSIRSIELDAKNINERVLRWQVSSFHKQGYDEIVVTNYSDNHLMIIEDLVKNLFVGFIIKEQSSIRIRLGSVALVDASEFDSTLRRAFRSLDFIFGDLHLAFKNKDSNLLNRQIDHEQTNNQLTNFCECLLNKSLDKKAKGHFWYVVAWNLEKIADNPKYIANYYVDKSLDVSKETISLLESVHSYAKLWYELFYDFSFDGLVNLSKLKKELETSCLDLLITAPKNDLVLINYLHMVVLQFADFSASTIALRID